MNDITEVLLLVVMTKYTWQAAFLLPLIFASSLCLIHVNRFALNNEP